MVTDRCSTLGLLFVLAIDYEDVHLRLVSMIEIARKSTFVPAFSMQYSQYHRMLIQLLVGYILWWPL